MIPRISIKFTVYTPADRQPEWFDQTDADVVARPDIENQPSFSVLDTLQYIESRLWNVEHRLTES